MNLFRTTPFPEIWGEYVIPRLPFHESNRFMLERQGIPVLPFLSKKKTITLRLIIAWSLVSAPKGYRIQHGYNIAFI
jgi:hypothetical protein